MNYNKIDISYNTNYIRTILSLREFNQLIIDMFS